MLLVVDALEFREVLQFSPKHDSGWQPLRVGSAVGRQLVWVGE